MIIKAKSHTEIHRRRERESQLIIQTRENKQKLNLRRCKEEIKSKEEIITLKVECDIKKENQERRHELQWSRHIPSLTRRSTCGLTE